MTDSALEYKGYRGNVEFSAADRCFFGRILGIRSLVTYEGTDVDSIEREFQASVDEYLDLCEQEGISPDKEYSGLFQVRVSPEIHRELAIKAEASGKKLNTIAAEALEKYAEAM
ncbi:MAG: type II toxin-antitoxin system HicB family antitoxin [Coriobacteriia bacterium]|nr:type II toxin-antitoxin system HicB family antitoxin [Coriobacteriia bacterium]MCL2749439.1 type II toxin-antitoxin system HicB family antitoxin [Coriobacteriia bacterium]